MPRVCVPNASLIASADLPILPFLAPRVFAESPITRSRPQDGRGDAAQKEKKKTTGCFKGPERLESAYEPRGLQQKPTRWQREWNRPNLVNRLYADISTFARQHARSYATATSGKRSAAVRASPSRRRVRRALSNRTASVPVRHVPLRAAGRTKVLNLERSRLSNYISRMPPGISLDELMKRGRYRSLSRRVSNLLRWNSTRLDLNKPAHGPARKLRLNTAFAALDRILYNSLQKYTRKIVIRHHPRCVQLSHKLFPLFTPVDTHELWASWLELDVGTRKAYAHRLLIYLLDRKPGRAVRFIQVLANDPLLRGQKTEAIADALGHLSKVHTKGLYGSQKRWGGDPAKHRQLFITAFVHIFERALASQRDVCSQDLLYNLAELAETDDLKKVFDCLVKHRTNIGFDTMLHYASAFGEAGEVGYALKCLHQLRERYTTVAWEAMLERERLRWTCATILRKSMSTSHDFHQTPSVVAVLVRLGIKMNILLYNIVMHNAMEAGDYSTAFQVYNTLESNGLEPDNHTYSILLHGCTLQSNPAMFESFAEHCSEVAKEIKDPWLATDYLYYLYVRQRIDTEVEHSSAMLWDAYSTHFSLAPLKAFVAPRMTHPRTASHEHDEDALDSTLLPPPPVALYLMLQVEIRSALAISNQRVFNLYQRFKSVAAEGGGPAWKSLVHNPTIWNAFLLAFCGKQQFANASQLIRDMTDGPAQPNIYTWNIFMQAFFKTGQVQAAERVFEIMRNRGTDPDQFTYGVLLRGYAKAQLMERIGEAMNLVETEQELEPDLLRALASVVNRRQLMLTLERSRLYKEERAQEEMDRKAKNEQARWQPPLFEAADVSRDESGEADMAAASQTEDSSTASMASDAAKSTEDEDVFSFLRDEAVDSVDASPISTPSTTASPVSEQPVQQPEKPKSQPKYVAANQLDPETQYRKLQEQLGLAVPAESSDDARPPEPQRPLGASIGFKSLLGHSNAGNSVNEVSVSKGRSRPKIKRQRLDRPSLATPKE